MPRWRSGSILLEYPLVWIVFALGWACPSIACFEAWILVKGGREAWLPFAIKILMAYSMTSTAFLTGQEGVLPSAPGKHLFPFKFMRQTGRFSEVRHSVMTLLALAGSTCLAIAIASGDRQPLAEAQHLRAEASHRLECVKLAHERVASRLHDLESLRASQPLAADRLEDLRSVVLDVASPGTGFGVRWSHPLLDLPEPSGPHHSESTGQWEPNWHVIDPSHRGPVAAFGLTLIFASVLSGGSDKKIHASSPDLDDTLPVNFTPSGEPQMPATSILAPDTPMQAQEAEWMPVPVDFSPPSSAVAGIDDEDDGDLFYFDDEDDDQDEDEDDGFFFDDDEEDEEESDDDDLDSDDRAEGEDEDEGDSGFGDDDDEEYEFED